MSDKTPCLNCGETVDPCACIRNKCVKCGEPVGNITFTICDKCWDNEHISRQQPIQQPIKLKTDKWCPAGKINCERRSGERGCLDSDVDVHEHRECPFPERQVPIKETEGEVKHG